ncbi:Nucleotidyltransferase domain-containing protein [Streptomyces atratus]|uniref:Nucleotidyltransferase domain-containing protein n=2 Tax=Streptomyces atratus TaxID=1893 RepID=A0A1K2F4A5_STRAR|nr:nucleotidyltransferase domain-containing protein [Streptomyces atratus]SFY42655.1 Nucleotidyltransferase domain-containing protein [Streptomyces atratus]
MTHRAEQSANQTETSQERVAEVQEIIDRITRWAANRQDIVGLLLVGSYARNAARPDSDIDIVLLTTDQTQYLNTPGPTSSPSASSSERKHGGPSPNDAMPRPQVWKLRSASGLRSGHRRTPSTLVHAVSSPTAPALCMIQQESLPL